MYVEFQNVQAYMLIYRHFGAWSMYSYIKTWSGSHLSILTWHRGYRDPLGGSPIVRPFHCTSVGLTDAIAPNVGDSGAQFLLVGDCVRAIPLYKHINQFRGKNLGLYLSFVHIIVSKC